MKQNKDGLDWHGTTIVLIRKNKDVVVAGDGQVSIGNTVMKSTAKKVRKIVGRSSEPFIACVRSVGHRQVIQRCRTRVRDGSNSSQAR